MALFRIRVLKSSRISEVIRIINDNLSKSETTLKVNFDFPTIVNHTFSHTHHSKDFVDFFYDFTVYDVDSWGVPQNLVFY